MSLFLEIWTQEIKCHYCQGSTKQKYKVWWNVNSYQVVGIWLSLSFFSLFVFENFQKKKKSLRKTCPNTTYSLNGVKSNSRGTHGTTKFQLSILKNHKAKPFIQESLSAQKKQRILPSQIQSQIYCLKLSQMRKTRE